MFAMAVHEGSKTLPITIDTAGLEPLSQGQWRDPTTGDNITVSFDNRPLTEPFWLEDLAGARRKLAHDYGGAGCLIEADPISLGGVPAMHQLAKFPHPQLPAGNVFVSSIFVAKTTCTARVTYLAAEAGTTGVREAALMARLGMPTDWVQPHPYDPAVQSRLPYIRADDPVWDTQYPDHPLSRARVWARNAAQTAVVDPGFAALPTYRA